MQVIPVLDLLDGHAVRAVRGERSRYRPIQSSLCATSDPVAIARALVAATGARTLYVADLGATIGDGAPDPERTLAAAQALATINRLFAGDEQAQKIIAGLSEGLTASEIRGQYGIEERDYDTTRKRIRRKLMRCGLAWGAR